MAETQTDECLAPGCTAGRKLRGYRFSGNEMIACPECESRKRKEALKLQAEASSSPAAPTTAAGEVLTTT